jgi:iron complex transport system ATP-binding protein
MSSPLIEIRDASFRFGERQVLSRVNLDVFRGEVLTVLGPNGCGKSTLLRCISGALTLDEGSARLDGIEISSLDVTARARKIGVLFQDHVPTFPFPVRDVVSMGRTPYLSHFGSPSPGDAILADEALAKVGMLHLKDRPYSEVSGGERQLVLLARTLVQQPEVILLDEPTAHLDFKNQTRSLRAIGELAIQGVTMVMTTHDPNHAFLFPGRVVLMQAGGKLIAGPAADVITDASLSATYGIDVAVLSVPDPMDAAEFRFCTPWYRKKR